MQPKPKPGKPGYKHARNNFSVHPSLGNPTLRKNGCERLRKSRKRPPVPNLRAFKFLGRSQLDRNSIMPRHWYGVRNAKLNGVLQSETVPCHDTLALLVNER